MHQPKGDRKEVEISSNTRPDQTIQLMLHDLESVVTQQLGESCIWMAPLGWWMGRRGGERPMTKSF